MPDDRKPPPLPPQAPSNLDKLREEFRRSALDKQLREERPNLDEPSEKPLEPDNKSELTPPAESREEPSGPKLDEPREEPGPAAAPPVKPKKTRPRLEIPHADEAIDQMLDERKADPRKLRLVKTQVDRAVEILRKQHHHTVLKRQRRTLERRIAERRDKSGR
jgi:hypothetical protein